MLTARDCLCPRYRVVGALQRYRDVAARNGNEVLVYAVFDEDDGGGRFLGLVEVREAAVSGAGVRRPVGAPPAARARSGHAGR